MSKVRPLLKKLFEKEIFTININATFLLIVAFFWSYSYVNICLPWYSQTTWTIILSLILLPFLIYSVPKKQAPLICIPRPILFRVHFKDFIIVGIYIVPLWIVLGKYLTTALDGDELYHAEKTHLLAMDISRRIAVHITSIEDMPFATLIRIFESITLILGISIGLFLYHFRKRRILFIFISISLFGLLRYFLPNVCDPHPPFRTFFQWLCSIILGIANVSYRLPQFCILILIGFVVYRRTSLALNFASAFLAGLSIITIPLLLHTATIVEFSIWTTFLLLLAFLLMDETVCDISWCNRFFLTFTLLSIGVLIRAPIFFVIVSLSIYFIIIMIIEKPCNTKNAIICITPMLIMTPLIIRNMIEGTPATYLPTETFSYLPQNLNAIERLQYVFSHNLVLEIAKIHIHSLWLFFLIPFVCNFKNSKLYQLWLLASFAIITMGFYLVRPILWGTGRYQAEFILPFIILGFLNVVLLLSRFNVAKKIMPFLFVGLIIFNINVFTNIIGNQRSYGKSAYPAVTQNPRILSKLYHNWDAALSSIKNTDERQKVKLFGIVYGSYPNILNNYTFREIMNSSNNIFWTKSYDEKFVKEIDSNPNIDTIFFTKGGQRTLALIRDFTAMNWILLGEFYGLNPEDVVVGLKRTMR